MRLRIIWAERPVCRPVGLPQNIFSSRCGEPFLKEFQSLNGLAKQSNEMQLPPSPGYRPAVSG